MRAVSYTHLDVYKRQVQSLVQTALWEVMFHHIRRSLGILHYVEQYCNHFIAFKLLAIIRHKVFAALRDVYKRQGLGFCQRY